jgi:hypothetical protein
VTVLEQRRVDDFVLQLKGTGLRSLGSQALSRGLSCETGPGMSGRLIDALDAAGPEIQAARYECSCQNPRGARAARHPIAVE